jgi:formate-dependent nitrite reductase cytochrome c552 subunit
MSGYNARKAWLERQRDYVRNLKTNPCADCHKIYPPCVMDFDHVRGKKKFNIARGLNKVSKDKLEAEILKCDLVCSNCHRIRTELRNTNR